MATAGCDPHRETFTVGIVDDTGRELAVDSFDNTPAGFHDAVRLLTDHDVDRVGIEGSGSLGRHLATALGAAGLAVLEVPPRRSAQWRKADRRHKTDRADAVSIARLTAADPALGPAKIPTDPAFAELEVLVEHRRSLTNRRRRLLAEADTMLCALPVALTSHIPRRGTASRRLRALLEHPPVGTDPAVTARVGWLIELAAEADTLTARIRHLDGRLDVLVDRLGSTLREEVGIGVVGAAELLARIGDPTRFRSEAAFARWNGTAPVAMSSGEANRPPHRHRLDRGGCRRVNSVLHVMAITQAGCDPRARAYLKRKRNSGKSNREARRALKRRLSDRIIRRMWRDHHHALALASPSAARAA